MFHMKENLIFISIHLVATKCLLLKTTESQMYDNLNL